MHMQEGWEAKVRPDSTGLPRDILPFQGHAPVAPVARLVLRAKGRALDLSGGGRRQMGRKWERWEGGGGG